MQSEANGLKRQAAQYFEMAALAGDADARRIILAMAEQKRRQALALAA